MLRNILEVPVYSTKKVFFKRVYAYLTLVSFT